MAVSILWLVYISYEEALPPASCRIVAVHGPLQQATGVHTSTHCTPMCTPGDGCGDAMEVGEGCPQGTT